MPLRRRQVTYSQRPNHAARSAHARGERQFRTYDTSYIRPKQSKLPVVIFAVVVIAVVALLVFGALSLMRGCTDGRSFEALPDGQTVQVQVAEGSGAKAIGTQLQEAGLLASPSEFVSRVSSMGVDSQLKPGTYTFSGGMSIDEMISSLIAGPGVGDGALAVPEGYTLEQIASRVEEVTNGRVSAVDFAEAASDASAYASEFPFLADAGTASLEGFLFPKTYSLDDAATADSIIRTMLRQFQTEIASLDFSYPESMGLSVYEAVNLASIVEKESSGDEGIRAQVASVFYNRLSNDGDPNYGFLQSDATTAYEVKRDPTAEDIAAPAPYNTYTNKGLPPSPICSPGLACLQAVCDPAETGYFFFYFAPDENGEMQYYFTETYEEHQETFS